MVDYKDCTIPQLFKSKLKGEPVRITGVPRGILVVGKDGSSNGVMGYLQDGNSLLQISGSIAYHSGYVGASLLRAASESGLEADVDGIFEDKLILHHVRFQGQEVCFMDKIRDFESEIGKSEKKQPEKTKDHPNKTPKSESWGGWMGGPRDGGMMGRDSNA